MDPYDGGTKSISNIYMYFNELFLNILLAINLNYQINAVISQTQNCFSFDFIFHTPSSLSKRHVLVRGEESHELRHLNDLNGTSPVDIEMSPGLGEVGVEI